MKKKRSVIIDSEQFTLAIENLEIYHQSLILNIQAAIDEDAEDYILDDLASQIATTETLLNNFKTCIIASFNDGTGSDTIQ